MDALYINMLVLLLMTLTLMQYHSGSAKAKNQRCMLSATKQAISIKFATTVDHSLCDFDLDFANVDMACHYFCTSLLLLSVKCFCHLLIVRYIITDNISAMIFKLGMTVDLYIAYIPNLFDDLDLDIRTQWVAIGKEMQL